MDIWKNTNTFKKTVRPTIMKTRSMTAEARALFLTNLDARSRADAIDFSMYENEAESQEMDSEENTNFMEELFKGSSDYQSTRQSALSLCAMATNLEQKNAYEFYLTLDSNLPFEYNSFMGDMNQFFLLKRARSLHCWSLEARSQYGRSLESLALTKIWETLPNKQNDQLDRDLLGNVRFKIYKLKYFYFNVCPTDTRYNGNGREFGYDMGGNTFIENYNALPLSKQLKQKMVAENMMGMFEYKMAKRYDFVFPVIRVRD